MEAMGKKEEREERERKIIVYRSHIPVGPNFNSLGLVVEGMFRKGEDGGLDQV